MKHAQRIGRVGGLAVGLGVGAALAATPWVAAADPFDPFDFNDIAISFNGITLFQEGTATAHTNAGDDSIAIADGANDSSFADGTNSMAETAGGSDQIARAIGDNSLAHAVSGNNDVAEVFDLTGGPGSTANASMGDDDTAIVYDLFGSQGSTAYVVGAVNHDFAAVFGDGSTATDAEFSSDSIAAVFADDSTATAGPTSNDIAAVFANDLTATAVGSGIIAIEPSSLVP
jgi:hypothetical protein